MNSFIDQVAIITGAASGIGLSIAHKLLAMKAQVVLFDMNEDNLHTEFDKYGKKAQVAVVNVTEEVQVQQAISTAICARRKVLANG